MGLNIQVGDTAGAVVCVELRDAMIAARTGRRTWAVQRQIDALHRRYRAGKPISSQIRRLLTPLPHRRGNYHVSWAELKAKVSFR